MASAAATGVLRRALMAYAFLALVGAFALAGAVLAAGITVTSSDHAETPVAAPSPTDDLGRELRTSFGVLAVVRVDQVHGLTAKDLAGFTHFPSYVPPSKMQVQVSLQLSNVLDHPVRYSAQQFSLRVGDGPPIAASGASIRSGTIQPAAAVDQTLSFIAPRNQRRGVPLTLEYRDPENGRPLLVHLGSARPARTPPPAATTHKDHLGHGRSP